MKSVFKTLAIALAAVGTVGCSHDAFDVEAFEKQEEATYTENFQKYYPSADLNQSWDYSTGQKIYSLPSSGSQARNLTRATNYKTTKGTFLLEKEVSDYMHKNMKAGMNNKEKGNPFYMKVPGNEFTIVPIFQGTASYIWELWMHVDNVGDIKVWTKGEDLYYKKEENSHWVKLGQALQDAVPEDAYSVKSPAYTFRGLPVGENMYFYLKVTNNNNRVASSLDQMMLTLTGFPMPANVPEGNEAMIVGCEDKDGAGSDYDYEDMVFMVYGNPVPPLYVLEERIEELGKRYMMEDLGALDDFDFNDVVFDVTNRTKEILRYTVNDKGEKKLTGTERVELPTMATIRAMGGTLDFTLKIGNTEWKKSSMFEIGKMYNTQSIDWNAKLAEFEVEGWNPDLNNVSLSVVKNNIERKIRFPRGGEAPMIIAVDPTVNWMKERVNIPKEWWDQTWWYDNND